MSVGSGSRSNWPFRIGVALLLIMCVGLLIYMVVPMLLAYENRELGSVDGWTRNSVGQITQVAFVIYNNGTKILNITGLQVNGTFLEAEEWIGGFSMECTTTLTSRQPQAIPTLCQQSQNHNHNDT